MSAPQRYTSEDVWNALGREPIVSDWLEVEQKMTRRTDLSVRNTSSMAWPPWPTKPCRHRIDQLCAIGVT